MLTTRHPASKNEAQVNEEMAKLAALIYQYKDDPAYYFNAKEVKKAFLWAYEMLNPK